MVITRYEHREPRVSVGLLTALWPVDRYQLPSHLSVDLRGFHSLDRFARRRIVYSKVEYGYCQLVQERNGVGLVLRLEEAVGHGLWDGNVWDADGISFVGA